MPALRELVLALVLLHTRPCMAVRGHATTVLIMSDTHRPTPLPTKTANLHFTSLSALVNAHYACRHSYDFIFMQHSEAGCTHPRFGRRHPSYCKLGAIAAALQLGWATVIFIDSDSWFVPDAPPIERMITAARGRPHGYGQGSAPSLFLAWDWPYSNGPNCGFMIWRNGNRARQLLAHWWHLDTGFNTQHDYEQRALYWGVAHAERFRGAIETLQLTPLAADATERHSPLIHVDHTRRSARYWRLSLAILAIGLQHQAGMDNDDRKGGGTIHSSHGGSDAVGGPLPNPQQLHPPAARLVAAGNQTAAALHRATTLLAQETQRGVLGLRRSVLRAALSAARMLLRTACYPLKSEDGGGGEGGDGDAEEEGSGRRRLASCLRVRRLNATRAAMSLLTTNLVVDDSWHAPPDGMAGVIEDEETVVGAMAAPAAVVTKSDGAAATSKPDGVPLGDDAAMVASLLSGVPLALKPCDPSLSPWQLWQLTAANADANLTGMGGSGIRLGSDADGLSRTANGTRSIAPTLFRLAAHPTLCIRLGPGRALREPYLPLAQLSECPIHGRRDATKVVQQRPVPSREKPTKRETSAGRIVHSDAHAPLASQMVASQIGYDGGTKAVQTSSLWDLHAHAQLAPLLTIRAMWPDTTAASRRANPRLFWPGVRLQAHSQRDAHLAGSGKEEAAFAVEEEVAVAEDGVAHESTDSSTAGTGSLDELSTLTRGVTLMGEGLAGVDEVQASTGRQLAEVHATASINNPISAPRPLWPWERAASNATRAPISAFVLKQRRWRMANADPRLLRQPCVSEYSAGDKRTQDCQTWCRPLAKPAHCRYCAPGHYHDPPSSCTALSSPMRPLSAPSFFLPHPSLRIQLMGLLCTHR